MADQHTRVVSTATSALLASVLAAAALALIATLPVAHADSPGLSFGQSFGQKIGQLRVIASADLDGDGDLDLVAGTPTSQLAVFRNDGQGTLVQTQVLSGDAAPLSLALGDLDGDGSIDIVAGNAGADAVYFNDGKGGFGPPQPLGGHDDATRAVVVGDLDGDGSIDVVTVNAAAVLFSYSPQPTFVYRNDGKGHFDQGQPLPSTSSPALAGTLGDVNGDGKLDLVLGTSDQELLYRNDGQGGFLAPTSIGLAADDGTSALALADLDGKNGLDLVVANTKSANQIYFNDGAGGFGPAQAFGSQDTWSLALGDLNADGSIDIVTGNYFGSSQAYLNDGAGGFASALSFGAKDPHMVALTLADLNGDGSIDILAASDDRPGVIYLGDGAGSLPGSISVPDADTTALALGDLDGDGRLDIVSGEAGYDLILGDYGGGQSSVALNDGRSFNPRPFGAARAVVFALALGDVNGDGSIDIVAGGRGQSAVYLNDGAGNFATGALDCADSRVRCFGPPDGNVQALALGDIDGDGSIDIVAGGRGQSAVYLNDGQGQFTQGAFNCAASRVRCFAAGATIRALALGDVNGDGAPDLVSGGRVFDAAGAALGNANALYLNDGAGGFAPAQRFDDSDLDTRSLALGDVNGDGQLDLVVGNLVAPNKLFLNTGGAFAAAQNIPSAGDQTYGVALGDVNGDGQLDLVSAARGQSVVQLNSGAGGFAGRRSVGKPGWWQSLALGDLNGDGGLDVVLGRQRGSSGGPSAVFFNGQTTAQGLPNIPPTVTITRPGPPDAVLSDTIIPISYTLRDREGDPVRAISVTYSLDGGGSWRSAVPSATTTLSLTAAPEGSTHVFNWDTFRSGVFGRSDDVVLRIVAYPSARTVARSVPGPYQRPYAAAQSAPFRLRGTQVRVLFEGQPAPGAMVYRLRPGQLRGGQPLGSPGPVLRSDGQGYLQGRGAIDVGDRLVALLPAQPSDQISLTEHYSQSTSLYYTSAAPNALGLDAQPVEQPGVQTLVVSRAHPLLLLDLDVSLEWDARSDAQFMARLQADLQRTSELLFGWTNGQAALGQVTIYHDRELWNEAHIRVYATNRLRPNANQGGIVSGVLSGTALISGSDVLSDPLTPTLRYESGQLRMGATWNRFGESDGNLGDDWPRTLGHELGHFAFFLDDNYLGLDAEGRLTTLDGCPGVMSDPYRYDKFHPAQGWQEACSQTLSNQLSGRADWQTITTFYPWLKAPSGSFGQQPRGPLALPLAVTTISQSLPTTPSITLAVPLFSVTDAGAGYRASPAARAFLFRADGRTLVDLGGPVRDQVTARGARPGDRLCVFEPATPPRSGCVQLATGSEELVLGPVPTLWQPDLRITPQHDALTLSVYLALPQPLTRTLYAQLYPAEGTALTATQLSWDGSAYVGEIAIPEDLAALEGLVHVWAEGSDTEAIHEQVLVDYSIGGNPGRKRARAAPSTDPGRKRARAAPRVNPGRKRARATPVLSADGQVIVFERQEFAEGSFLSVQASTALPPPPPYASFVGQGYRITAPAGVSELSATTSINIGYPGNAVPSDQERWLEVYRYDEAQRVWQRLPSEVSESENEITAPATRSGLYAVLASVQISLPVAGWNLVAWPLQGTQPVSAALASIAGSYTTVYGYAPGDEGNPWQVYDARLPAWANDLNALAYGHGYWIHTTRPLTLRIGGVSAAATPGTPPAPGKGLPQPPLLLYGTLGPELAAQPGTALSALIAEQECGSSEVRRAGEALVYALKVAAASDDQPACGAPSRPVSVQLDGQQRAAIIAWSNSTPRRLDLGEQRVFGPLVLR